MPGNDGENIINLCLLLLIILACFSIYNITLDFVNYIDDNYTQDFSYEGMINIPQINHEEATWSRTSSCKHYMDDTTYKVLNDANIKNTKDYNEADIIFPCGYNNIDDEIKSLPNVYHKNNPNANSKSGKQSMRVFIIDGADEITAKNYLWKNMFNYHGLKKAKVLSPNTYLLSGPQKDTDLARLSTDHVPGKMYILKKNVQRQTGLEITDNIDMIKKNANGYVLVQELLEDSYLVNGRKINLRVYIIVVCHKDNTDVYVFDNGFMYYTKNKFVKGLKDKDNHITTGYVDRDVYDKNPLTHTDFKQYLDLLEGSKYHATNDPRKLYQIESDIRKQGRKISDVVFKRINDLIADIFISFKGNICRKTDSKGDYIQIYDDYSVQIFGADVAINDQLQPQIIEINKGPDLSPKDDRDGSVKRKMVNDVLEIIGVKQKSNNNGLNLVLEM